MDSFFIAFNAVAPLACYIIIGILVKKLHLADDNVISGVNRLLFKVFYPVVVFANVYKSDFSQTEDTKLVIYAVAFTVFTAAFLTYIVPKFIKNKASCGAFVQAGFRSNVVLFGIPLAASVFGSDNVGSVSITAAFIVPLYNVLAVIILEYFSGKSSSKKSLVINIIKNPLIQGAFIGLIYNMLNLPTPYAMQNIVKSISDSTTVFALIILGASLKFSSMKENRYYIIANLFLSLFVVPAAAVLGGYLLGLRYMQLFAILIITATPVATASYTMAQNMNSDHQLAAQLVAISTVLSVFTIFAWIMAFFSLGLIS